MTSLFSKTDPLDVMKMEGEDEIEVIEDEMKIGE
jgi:hypothetical protein